VYLIKKNNKLILEDAELDGATPIQITAAHKISQLKTKLSQFMKAYLFWCCRDSVTALGYVFTTRTKECGI
jgi:hypothetical protein